METKIKYFDHLNFVMFELNALNAKNTQFVQAISKTRANRQKNLRISCKLSEHS